MATVEQVIEGALADVLNAATFDMTDATRPAKARIMSAIEQALDGLTLTEQATSAMRAGERNMLARARRALLAEAPDERA